MGNGILIYFVRLEARWMAGSGESYFSGLALFQLVVTLGG